MHLNTPAAMAARRAPALSGLPLAPLLERTEELARRWAIALILARPLQAIGELPLEDLALEAPALCARLLEAVGSDDELDALLGPRAATGRLAELAGARDGAELAAAIEALRGVLWEALLLELGSGASEGRRAAEAGDRLAFVCSSALAVALADGSPTPPARQEPEPGASPASPVRPRRYSVIVDEQGTGAGSLPDARERPLQPPHEPPARPPVIGAGAVEISARDQRGEEGPAAWIGSVGRELVRFGRDGLPFAVLLLEVPAVARMWREGVADGRALAARVERALAAELRDGEGPWRADAGPALTRERAGRYWLIAPRLDRGRAELLAERLARAVAWAGDEGALELVAGVAVCPEDGRDAAGLAAHADIELYAARRAR